MLVLSWGCTPGKSFSHNFPFSVRGRLHIIGSDTSPFILIVLVGSGFLVGVRTVSVDPFVAGLDGDSRSLGTS
jgi:hypothetical protein